MSESFRSSVAQTQHYFSP